MGRSFFSSLNFPFYLAANGLATSYQPPSYLAALLHLGVLRLGPLRISAYSLCAALGLLAALWLSLKTAKALGLDPAELWDAALVALTAGFAVSRILLVVRNWHAFLHYPMLVLALPSFTYAGMALTALLVFVYLRRRRLPLLRLLDAWAPCAALLAAFLELGHWLEGSDAGMPWLPGWHLIPVQPIAAFASAALAAILLWHLRHPSNPGALAATGLLAGGALAFALDMLSQPSATDTAWLDPGQWIALGSILTGLALLQLRRQDSRLLPPATLVDILPEHIPPGHGNDR